MTAFRRLPPVHSPLSARALAAGWVATLRPDDSVRSLETAVGARFDAGAVALTDSGTSALMLAIRAALRGRGGAALALPAYCCYDVATAAAGADASVVLYDVDPTTLGPDWGSLERVLRDGAGAVVVAHLFGMAVDMERALALSAATGATLIEDAAQGAGGELAGKTLGSMGPLAVLSFGRGKGMTGGAGGALLARGAGMPLAQDGTMGLLPAAGAARALVAASAQWLFGRPALYGLPAALPFLRLGETVYREPQTPREMAAGPAAVALQSLDAVDGEAQVRRGRARRLAEAALSAGITTVNPIRESKPGYLRFPMLLDGSGATAANSGGALGIVRAYPRCLGDLKELASRWRNRDEPLPGARRLAAGLHTAPIHSRLTDLDLARVVSWIAAPTGRLLL